MNVIRAVSVSRPAQRILFGPARRGVGLGHGYVDLGGYVLAFTSPGAPRMPDGIECGYIPAQGDAIRIGEGRIEGPGVRILPGPTWDPVPHVALRPPSRRDLAPHHRALAGLGEGLTPAGDDVLIGYVAGLALFRRWPDMAHHVAESAARRTSALSATLLRHAALGEVPEPVHALLERGDASPLTHWGHSSGRHMLHGLELAA